MSLADRISQKLTQTKSASPLVVWGDANTWKQAKDKSQGADLLNNLVFDISSDNSADIFEAEKHLSSGERVTVLIVNGTVNDFTRMLSKLSAFSTLLWASDEALDIAKLDMYSTIHFNNLLVEVV